MVINKIPIASCTVLFKRLCFNDIRFDENLQYAEEWECFQRVFCIFNFGVLVDVVLYFNRKHPNSNTGEFYKNNPIRISSQKAAILLVAKNLKIKNKLSKIILNYLIGLAISFRDCSLLNAISKISSEPFKKKVFLNFKFIVYPFWRLYKKIEKRIK